MSEWLVIVAIAVTGLSGVAGLVCRRGSPAAERLSMLILTLGCMLAGAGSVLALARGRGVVLRAAWSVPGGQLAIGVDAISAMFVLQIALLAALGACYGLEYWPERAHPHDGRKLRVFYGAVTAGMLTLVVAQNAVLFLLGWEIMALAAFMLVSTEDEKPTAREVGYVYLLATRFGTLCLFAMFALLGAVTGTLDMREWPRAFSSPSRDAIFMLGLAGFGLKAGIMPLHVWLPGAHANAPSHVSALMSGVLIKTGIYGLVRLTSSCAAPPLWWGYALVGLGTISGILGVGFALAQHDLKRLLAYHSVENIGIICIGLGLAVLGRSVGRGDLVALGVGGALLHVWNHGLFKSLLFFSAGSVLHATGTREIDRLGALSRRMPHTSLGFLIGAVAICGLPPLNGLISELLIYVGLFRASSGEAAARLLGAIGAPSLALIGALAIACFVKVYGSAFLGAARSPDVERAREVGAPMLVPMAILAACCAFVGLGAPIVARVLDAGAFAWAGQGALQLPPLNRIVPLAWVSAANGLLVVFVAALGAALAFSTRSSAQVGTWDCGYAAPAARMQYTSSSFAATLVGLLGWALRPKIEGPAIQGPFPRARAAFRSGVPDLVLDRVILPAFAGAERVIAWLRPIQRGSVHLYLLYIVGTLVLLLLWR